MVDILMKAGASPNVLMYGRFPLIVRLAENRNIAMIKSLIKYGADPNVAYQVTGYRPHGFTTLMASVDLKDVDSVRVLLDAGARVDMRVQDRISDLDGYTALMIAEKHKSADAVELLLKHGARTDTLASDGMTPITLAKQNVAMLKMLTEKHQVN
jgi:ankyrin repeat protein